MSGILVTGASGLVGNCLIQQLLQTTDQPIHALYHRKINGTIPGYPLCAYFLDIADLDILIQTIMAIEPEIIFHSAAVTNVDYCEQNKEHAYAVNVLSTEAIAKTCVSIRARLVYVSTDYVFDGSDKQPGPYAENAQTHPINYYGLTKYQGEVVIQSLCSYHTSWAICRTCVVYSAPSKIHHDFISWMSRELGQGHLVSIVTDQWNTPVLLDHLVSMLIAVGLRGEMVSIIPLVLVILIDGALHVK
ncbi:SDR family oxidoreductase [Dictyobacter kobayashii]|uniref:dTDP-4-dehydrorhamnose reductase n=1 Tax=Dictyobacter kobayashii TaxID=2014872 RepID=A0A402AC83_9CHLR|nr:SDR family oxidoreductase [Dictyobacter kobayashii]GCE16699.1 hypothetical protein KDK_04990 [Dictyobacter kobayashii]